MKCKVQGVYMNPRYRVLNINEEKYILDMGKCFWKILFPFSFWIFPNTAYKVNDNKIIENIIVPETKPKATEWNGLLAGAIGLVLANLIYPLINYLDIESTPLISSIIVAFVFLITLSVFFYINIRSKISLSKAIDLFQYSKKRLWIRPQSSKHFLFILLVYFLSLGLTVLFLGSFVQVANAFILFAGMFFMFMLIGSSYITIGVGDTTVRFKDDKKAKI